MRTLGIDLSADPDKTAACQIDWVDGTIELLRRPMTDAKIVAAILGSDKTAIDVPLGWPDAFVDALVAHRDGAHWPSAAITSPSDREPMRYRVTDLIVRAGGAKPLSVSTDRIGVTAMRGARLQHLLRESGVVVDRSGVLGNVVEAYPAAALGAWGLPSQGYKTAKNTQTRSALVEAMAHACGSLASEVSTRLDRSDDDDLDAFICAVVARAAALHLTTPPAPDQIHAARREGWIHVPVASLDAIIGATQSR
jgi:predicted nuclease with RNAse H fold